MTEEGGYAAGNENNSISRQTRPAVPGTHLDNATHFGYDVFISILKNRLREKRIEAFRQCENVLD